MGGDVGPDTVSSERFTIRRRLGAGGFGEVYEALDTERNEVVALKTLVRLDAEALYRFKKEFRSLADLSHPNLITLHELFSDGSQWFFTMELVDGTDLLSYLRPGSRESPEHESSAPFPSNPGEADTREVSSEASPAPDMTRLRAVFAQLARGVGALHDKGKLHRDIKPSNVLVDRDGRVVLVDFGLVREVEAAQSTEHMLGTPAYMAPEQIEGKVTEASDWYAMGVVLFQALTGRLPFEGPALQVLVDKQQSHPPFPSEPVTETPDDLSVLCLELLSRDPAKRPTSSAVLEELGNTRTLANQSPVQAREDRGDELFVGRDDELVALREAFDSSRSGQPVMVHISGRSGMGKTALLNRFLEGLVSDCGDVVILRGRCYEQESVPFKALDGVVDALCTHLVGLDSVSAAAMLPRHARALALLFPVLDRVSAIAAAPRSKNVETDARERRRKAFMALAELLGRLSDRGPLVIAIDDGQWGDVDSAVFIGELLHRDDPTGLLLLVCSREEDRGSEGFLGELREQTDYGVDVTRIDVGALPSKEARELSGLLLGDDADELRASAIAEECGGSPIFLKALARDSSSLQDGGGATLTLEHAIRLWVSGLPEPAQRALEIVAIAGQPIEIDAVVATSGVGARARSALADLRHARLIRTGGDGAVMECYHDRIRETVAGDLPTERHRLLHGLIADWMEEHAGHDAERLAFHCQMASLPERARKHALVGARRAAMKLAFAQATKLFRLALDLGLDDEGLIRCELADALVNDGHNAEAAREYLLASQKAEGANRLELQSKAMEHFLISGHLDKGLDVSSTVLAEFGLTMPRTETAALTAMFRWRAWLRVRGLRFTPRKAEEVPPAALARLDTLWSMAKWLAMTEAVRADGFACQYLLEALRAGEANHVARGLCMMSSLLIASGGRSAEARFERFYKLGLELSESCNDPYLRYWQHVPLMTKAWTLGEWSDCAASADRAAAECDASMAYELASARDFALESLLKVGHWRELASLVPAYLKDARARRDHFMEIRLCVCACLFVSLAQDEPARGIHVSDEALSRWPGGRFDQIRFWWLFSRVHAALYEGRPVEAWKLIDGEWGALKAAHFLRIPMFDTTARTCRANAALAAARVDDDSDRKRSLLRVASRDAQRIERRDLRISSGTSQWIRAGVVAVREGADAALPLLRSAETGLADVDLKLHSAAVRRCRGLIISGDEGQALVDSADAVMREEGVVRPDLVTTMLAPGIIS